MRSRSGIVVGAAMMLGLLGEAKAVRAAALEPGSCPAGEPATSAAVSGYMNPLAVAATFCDALSARFAGGECASPKELLQQARERPRCSIAFKRDEGPALDAVSLYAGVRRGVVVVGGIFTCPKCKKWHAECASGFVLTEDGAIATNFHVLEAFEKVKAVGVMRRTGVCTLWRRYWPPTPVTMCSSSRCRRRG